MSLSEEKCNQTYWTNKRFAPEVIDAYKQALQPVSSRPLHLYGYSGGAAIAVILTAELPNIASLTTIAGNLDIDKFASIHQVTPLQGSLNPADFAEKLGGLPQTHYVGAKDDIIPLVIYESYAKRLAKNNNAKLVIIPHATHEKGWDKL